MSFRKVRKPARLARLAGSRTQAKPKITGVFVPVARFVSQQRHNSVALGRCVRNHVENNAIGAPESQRQREHEAQ